MCCEAEWKREDVQDHKFDFVNTREFHKTDILTRIKYVFVYIFLFKSIAVYGLDIFTAVTMLSTNHWTNAIYSKCGNDCAVKISFDIAKWIFVGCIIFSFLLLGYETYKARKVILSRDISYAFTNLMANDYYSLRSYDHFCLFCHINNSTKKKDDFAFFIFFTFKGWKRLLLADGPRQSINALTLYSFAYANGFQTSNIPAYWDDSAITAMLLWSMILTVLIFLGSLLLLVFAAIGYIPLLCYIQGNLKEYVCHKVDKRISELIKRKRNQRIAKNAEMEKKLARGAGLKNSKGKMIKNLDILQPTLPTVDFEDDDGDMAMRPKRRVPEKKWDAEYDASESPLESGCALSLTRPAANDYYTVPYQNSNYAYSDEYSSSTNLAASAAPIGISYPPGPPTPQQASYTSSAFPNPYSPGMPNSRSQQQLYHQQPQHPQYDRRRSDRSGHSGLSYDPELYSNQGWK
ncbi:hypothetical protein P7C73_g5938, partial [Tremellales sp. Uapishka_1]